MIVYLFEWSILHPDSLFPSQLCLTGCGPEGKHLALEAVTAVLDRPPPPPPPTSTSSILTHSQPPSVDPRTAVALQRVLQCAIFFLGENSGKCLWASCVVDI